MVKRSNSLPASNKPGSKPLSSTPLGASKYPGKNQVNGATGTARKAVTGGVNRARSTAGGVTGGASKAVGGVVGSGQKALTGAPSSFKGPSSTPAPYKTLPKPYPNANSLPKANSTNAFPSSGSKTAVKPGAPKAFVPPVEQKKAGGGAKAYPGTNTIPGQGSKTPVTQQKFKPLPRMAPQIGAGQKMNHISV